MLRKAAINKAAIRSDGILLRLKKKILRILDHMDERVILWARGER